MKILVFTLLCLLFRAEPLPATDQKEVLSDTASVSVAQERNVFLVNYLNRNGNERNIVISIFDEQNKIVFTESFSNTGSFKKPYNFQGLPDGIYIIKITDEQMVTIRPVQYVAVLGEEEAAAKERLENLKKDLVIRVIRPDEKTGKYKVDILSGSIHQLELKIFDQKQNLVFEGPTESKTSRIYVLRNQSGKGYYFRFFDKENNLIQEIVH